MTQRLNGASEREWAEWVRGEDLKPQLTGATKPVRRARTIRLNGLAEERYEVVYDDMETGEPRTFGWSAEPDGGSAMVFTKLLRFTRRPRVVDTEQKLFAVSKGGV